MQVALFVTCLVDLFRPNIGFATIKLLQKTGCDVDVPIAQTCCGQPAFNNGDRENARELARQAISLLENYEYVVLPSGSCTGMLRLHYPALFSDDTIWHERAVNLAERTFEITQFLTSIVKIDLGDVTYAGKVTWHDSCSALRELRIRSQPRELLRQIGQLELEEMPDTESCCGFGGSFCVKYPEISQHMVDEKIRHIEKSDADTLLAADLGCLLNIAGRLKYINKPIRAFHITEVLAGMANGTDIAGFKTTS